MTVHIEACLAELGNRHGLWIFNGCSLVSVLTLRCHVGARLIFRHIHIFKVDGRTWSKVVSSYSAGRYQQLNGASYIVEIQTATQLFMAPGPMTRVCCQTPMCYESLFEQFSAMSNVQPNAHLLSKPWTQEPWSFAVWNPATFKSLQWLSFAVAVLCGDCSLQWLLLAVTVHCSDFWCQYFQTSATRRYRVVNVLWNMTHLTQHVKHL